MEFCIYRVDPLKRENCEKPYFLPAFEEDNNKRGILCCDLLVRYFVSIKPMLMFRSLTYVYFLFFYFLFHFLDVRIRPFCCYTHTKDQTCDINRLVINIQTGNLELVKAGKKEAPVRCSVIVKPLLVPSLQRCLCLYLCSFAVSCFQLLFFLCASS